MIFAADCPMLSIEITKTIPDTLMFITIVKAVNIINKQLISSTFKCLVLANSSSKDIKRNNEIRFQHN